MCVIKSLPCFKNGTFLFLPRECQSYQGGPNSMSANEQFNPTEASGHHYHQIIKRLSRFRHGAWAPNAEPSIQGATARHVLGGISLESGNGCAGQQGRITKIKCCLSHESCKPSSIFDFVCLAHPPPSHSFKNECNSLISNNPPWLARIR